MAKIGVGQQATVRDDLTQPVGSISIGQRLQAAKQVLERRHIQHHEGGFALRKRDADESHLSFRLDEEHTWVCVFYSKDQGSITGISMVFSPSRQSDKYSQSWIPATKIDLYADSSYAIKFSKPRTSEQIKEAEANRSESQFPPSRLR